MSPARLSQASVDAGRADPSLPYLDAASIRELVPMADAIDAIERSLMSGLDPGADPPRERVEVAHGQLLLMSAEVAGRVGVKVTSVSDGTIDPTAPRIQAIYILMDSETLTPQALFDGTALTSLRTPAVSAVAARRLYDTSVPLTLLVFGCGPQALGHIEALSLTHRVGEVIVVGRDATRTDEFARRVRRRGVSTVVGTPADVTRADLIVCATTATTPLFAGSDVKANSCVIAMGAHEKTAMELDDLLMVRSTVVVEDTDTALREAGEVVHAIESGRIDRGALFELKDLVRTSLELDCSRPRVFKSVGMPWEDLVVARLVLDRFRQFS